MMLNTIFLCTWNSLACALGTFNVSKEQNAMNVRDSGGSSTVKNKRQISLQPTETAIFECEPPYTQTLEIVFGFMYNPFSTKEVIRDIQV